MIALTFDPVSALVSPYSIPLLITAGLCLLLGLVILIRERGSIVSWSFALLDWGIAAGLIARAGTYATDDPTSALWWAKVADLGVSFIPPAAYLFAVVIVGTYRQRASVVWTAWIVAGFLAVMGFATNAAFVDLYHYPWGYYPRYRMMILPDLAFFLVLFVLCLREFLLALRRAPPSSIYHRRARTLAITFALGYFAGVDFLPGFGVPVYPFGYLIVVLFLALIAWTIWHHRLADITPAYAANQIIETMTDALLVLDADGIVRLANRAARELFSCRDREPVGRPAEAVLGKALTKKVFDWSARAEAVQDREVIDATDATDPRVLSVSLSRMRYGRAETAAIVCVARDVTEQVRRAEQLRAQGEELRTAYHELQEAQAKVVQQEQLSALGLMASGIAHNFNNVLTPILAYGQLLLDRPRLAEDREKREKYLRLIVDASRDAARMLARLRDFYRPASGEAAEAVDLSRTIQEAIDLTRPRWHDQAGIDGKQIEVVTRLDPVPPVVADPTELREVLANLILNSVDAITKDGTISLRIRADGEQVVLVVSDTGVGMSDEVRRHCFEPFFTTKGERGTGLGLSTIYGVVRRTGGTINVESALGQGTTFTIHLPAAVAPAAAPPSPRKAPGTTWPGGSPRG